MKTSTLIVAAVAALVIVRAKKQEAKANQIAESVPRSGSDFVTNMWDTLQGGGLTAPGYQNLAPGANADPGNVGRLQAGLIASWDGSMNMGL